MANNVSCSLSWLYMCTKAAKRSCMHNIILYTMHAQKFMHAVYVLIYLFIIYTEQSALRVCSRKKESYINCNNSAVIIMCEGLMFQ